MPAYDREFDWEEQRQRDKTLNVVVWSKTDKDEAASVREGRPIFKTYDMVTIRRPADRESTSDHPVWQEWKKHGDQILTYEMRFQAQVNRYRASQPQVVEGTPLSETTFLNPAEQATLRALGVYTVEQLAAMSGQPLKNLGPNGLEQQQKAEKYLNRASGMAEVTTLAAENVRLKQSVADMAAQGADPRVKFVEMTEERLREFIKERGGEIRGNPGRSTLLRMAVDLDQTTQAAQAA